ncbi:MAG: hypothetical protein FWG11_02015 [Promicromonosporaceae bacterium]|nr:hypothetical protein [Promicromonosporaceae bacterium]
MPEHYNVTAYDPYEHFFGARYKQGGRTVYALDFSVSELVSFLPKPDADRPLEAADAQRRIYPAHARAFARYIEETEGWVSPALLLRGPDIFKFDRKILQDTGTTQFGVVSVPKDSRTEIKIVDGQHRTLGFHLAWENLSKDITNARAMVASARTNEESPEVIANLQAKLDCLIDHRTKLAGERVSIQIVVTDDPTVARRIFVDINDNAKGITGSVRSRFDDRKVLSRALNLVLNRNDLLKNRVDLEADRVMGASKYLVGAKQVADMIRAVTVGNGRIGKRQEQELDEKMMADEFELFTLALTEAFVDLAAVQEGNLTPKQLRQTSLLGSSVILRGLAAAWYELSEDGSTSDEITAAFKGLAEGMAAPVFPEPEDTWFATGLFSVNPNGVYSPSSRSQDIKNLTNYLVEWCDESPDWVRSTEAPEAT